MNDTGGDVKKAGPIKITDEACDAADAAGDPNREAAKQVYEQIKSAREKAAKKTE